MMNVLIVDDEPIVRKVLKTMIRWEEHGLQWAGEAADGLDAWEFVRSGRVDLIVTDILMPRMDGLELVKRLKEEGADVAIVVLSCLDDFAYVKEAMKRGAHDYILKPTMEPEQLAVILGEAREALQSQRTDKAQRERLHRELQQSKQAQWGLRLQKTWISGEPDEELANEWFGAGAEMASFMIYFAPGAALPVLGWHWPDALAYVSLSEQRLLLFYDKPGNGGGLADFLGGEAGLMPESYLITEVAGIRCAEQLRDVIAMHESKRHGYFYGYEAADGTDREAADGFAKQAAEGLLPQEEKQNLLRAVAGMNEEAMNYWSRQIGERLLQLQPAVDAAYAFVYELLGQAAAFARQQTAADLEPFERKYVTAVSVQSHLRMDSLAAWLTEACRVLARQLQAKPLPVSRNPFVRKAIHYMERHYHLQISTSDIAEHVRLSRSYLSDLYGKETGESLTETLTAIRIDEAKRLLTAGERKVYEVAEAVGFIDAKAFAKTFKRIVGCTPKEYEEQNK
ncbi:putative response regulatory protein [Paenibacillus konkukensis]|uniref:Response regulatory protein n=1 Tax=Paenibacillus konkukensis TaxID=2020716 RepID=A0ABY4RGK9_9BACL|nr:response regulator [Paenibacillus konkukensis]UQZ81591.1 putative response regulatory protein [Paenibacillus konkukensis]